MISCFISVLFLIVLGVHSQNVTNNETRKDDPRCPSGCIWEESLLDLSTLKYFPKNCTTVCADNALVIGYETDLTEKQMIDTFKNMKYLIGDLIINRSKYKSGIFFASLETIDCDNVGTFQWTLNSKMTEIGMANLKNVSCRLRIVGNNNMTRLNLPNMIPVQSRTANYSKIDIDIANSSPDFCITVQEMSNFISNDLLDFRGMTNGVSGKFCEISNTTNSTVKLCNVRNSTLATMDSGCVKLLGDVIIEGKDEPNVQKLESVESIFGSLTIKNTNLTNINFLGKLKHIVSLKEEQPGLKVEYNRQLTNVSLPSIKHVESRVYVPIVFNNNSQELLKNPNFCNGILDRLTDRNTWIVKFDGEACLEIEEKAATVAPTAAATSAPTKDKSARNLFSESLTLILLFISFTLNA